MTERMYICSIKQRSNNDALKIQKAKTMKVTQLGPDGRLIAKGNLSTLEMQLTNEHPNSEDHGKVRVWENGRYSATVTKKQAQEILDERAEQGYDDEIKIV